MPSPPPPPPGLFARLLTRWLIAGAPGPVARRIHARIRKSPIWSAWYSSLRAAERAHFDASPAQLDLVESLVLADIAPAPRKSLARPAFAALAAATAAAVLFVVVRDAQDDGVERIDDPATMTERGGDDDATPLVGVRLRCLDRATQEQRAAAKAGPREPAASLTCARNDLVSAAFTNLSGATMHVVLVGVGAGGDLRWLQPFSPDSMGVEIRDGTVDEPVAVAADLATLPYEERIVVHAVFTEAPLSGRELVALLHTSRQGGMLTSALPRLPVPIEHQAQIELHRTP